MPRSCWAPQCNHNSVRESCSFFRFPAEEQDLKKWLKLLRRAEDKPGPHHRVCSCHFKEGKKENGPEMFTHNVNKMFTRQEKRKRRTVQKSREKPKSKKLLLNEASASTQELAAPLPSSDEEVLEPGVVIEKVMPFEPEASTSGIQAAKATQHSAVLLEADNYLLTNCAAAKLERQKAEALRNVPAPLFTLPIITDVRTEIEEDTSRTSSSITSSSAAREKEKSRPSSHHDIDPLEEVERREEKDEDRIFEIVDSSDDERDDVKDPLELSEDISEDNVRTDTTEPAVVMEKEQEDGDFEGVGVRIQALQAQIGRLKSKVLYLRVLAEDFTKQTITSRPAVMS